jgi:NAD+ diphosphatase
MQDSESWDLDRIAHLRSDSSWLKAQLANHALLVAVWRGLNLFTTANPPAPLFLPANPEVASPLFLGIREHDQAAFFATNVNVETEDEALSALFVDPAKAHFSHLRSYTGHLSRSERNVLFYARSLGLWHEELKFCHRCSSRLQAEEAGHVLACPNASCGAKHFPRSDPATIMLVHHDDHCLLGRQPDWPQGMFSTLAGFAEVGETLEDAVRREVKEESGILVEKIRYFGSQPWPFPQSLMLGFFAEAITTDIVRGVELEDVRWFNREETARILDRLSSRYPHLDTIARRLIRHWLEEPVGRARASRIRETSYQFGSSSNPTGSL